MRPAVVALLSAAIIWAAPVPALAQGVYAERNLSREAARLERAVRQIFEIVLEPHLTREERRAIAGVRIEFPMPGPDDPYLNFYAGLIDGQPTVILPLQSLKLVEDLATAFAWSYETRRDFGPLDLYFAMLQRRPLDDFGPPGRRDILSVLGVPPKIWETNEAVDRLGLRLRNEAFAFILAHELGHLRFRHGPVAARGPAGARADEIESDAFALDLLARAATPPLGAVLFFQAQIYSLPHRGDHRTAEAWQAYLETASTHPLSVDRIRAMGRMIRGPLASKRGSEAPIWRDIARRLSDLSTILADVDLHNCIAEVAFQAPTSLLREPARASAPAMRQYCARR